VDHDFSARFGPALFRGMHEIELVWVTDPQTEMVKAVGIQFANGIDTFRNLAITFAQLRSECPTGGKDRISAKEARLALRAACIYLHDALLLQSNKRDPLRWIRKTRSAKVRLQPFAHSVPVLSHAVFHGLERNVLCDNRGHGKEQRCKNLFHERDRRARV
jgi:hypothetical protein